MTFSELPHRHTLVNPENSPDLSSQTPPLVLRCISDRSFSFEYGASTVKVRYPSFLKVRGRRGGPRGRITEYSKASGRRLQQAALDADPSIKSRMCLTYPQGKKPNGVKMKEDLFKWLKRLARLKEKFGYFDQLWVMEFHTKKGSPHEGYPHYHIYLTWDTEHPDTRQLHLHMAKAWNDIVDPEDVWHKWWHERYENFEKWEVRNGAYFRKYIFKSDQKRIPEGFGWTGRFWGHSAGLIPPKKIKTSEDLKKKYFGADPKMAQFILRSLCNSQARKIDRHRRRKARGRIHSYTYMTGRKALDQIFDWCDRQAPF